MFKLIIINNTFNFICMITNKDQWSFLFFLSGKASLSIVSNSTQPIASKLKQHRSHRQQSISTPCTAKQHLLSKSSILTPSTTQDKKFKPHQIPSFLVSITSFIRHPSSTQACNPKNNELTISSRRFTTSNLCCPCNIHLHNFFDIWAHNLLQRVKFTNKSTWHVQPHSAVKHKLWQVGQVFIHMLQHNINNIKHYITTDHVLLNTIFSCCNIS